MARLPVAFVWAPRTPGRAEAAVPPRRLDQLHRGSGTAVSPRQGLHRHRRGLLRDPAAGFGTAMDRTGAGKLVVNGLMTLVRDQGPAVVLPVMYALTSILTAFLSNEAAAIRLTPLAIGLSQQVGVEPRRFVMAVMFAASAGCSTPIGYQTNTPVYAAGGYRFLDFTEAGLPLNVLLWVIASLVLPISWPLGQMDRGAASTPGLLIL